MTENGGNQLAVIADRDKKELEAMISGVCVARPTLKERLTVASAWYFMQLPDSSYGWTANQAMSKFEKLMLVAAHVQLGLMPGMGLINILGNKMYLTVAAAREKALPHVISRRPRACTDDEKEMLGVSPGDRCLALEIVLKVDGQEIETTGYGIIDKEKLDYRSNGKTLPGLGNKKDIFQTLQTRAEKDIYKHHIPMEGFAIEPDPADAYPVLDAEILPQRSRLPSPEAKPIAQVAETAVADSNKKIHREQLDALTNRLIDVVNAAEKKGIALTEITAMLGMNSNTLLQQPLEKIEAAIEAIQDMQPPNKPVAEKPTANEKKRGRPAKEKQEVSYHPLAPPAEKKPIEQSADPIAGARIDVPPQWGDGKNRPRNKAYMLVQLIIGDKKISSQFKAGARELWDRLLYPGDEDIIKQELQMMDGPEPGPTFREFIESRKPLPNIPEGSIG